MDNRARGPVRAANKDDGPSAAFSIARQAHRRRRLQTAVGCWSTALLAACPLLGLLARSRVGDDPFGLRGLFWVGLVVVGGLMAAYALTALVWRCPACRARLDSRRGTLQPVPLRFCPSCGARLVVEWDEAGAPDREYDRRYRA